MKTWLPLVVMAVGIYLALGGQLPQGLDKLIPQPGPAPAPAPLTPDLPTPASDLQKLVEPITTALEGHPEKAAVVRALYRDFAEVLQRDRGQVITTTQTAMTAHARLLDLALKETPLATNPPLGPLIDAAIEGAMGGKASVKLDDANRAKFVASLQAIAWSARAN